MYEGGWKDKLCTAGAQRWVAVPSSGLGMSTIELVGHLAYDRLGAHWTFRKFHMYIPNAYSKN